MDDVSEDTILTEPGGQLMRLPSALCQGSHDFELVIRNLIDICHCAEMLSSFSRCYFDYSGLKSYQGHIDLE